MKSTSHLVILLLLAMMLLGCQIEKLEPTRISIVPTSTKSAVVAIYPEISSNITATPIQITPSLQPTATKQPLATISPTTTESPSTTPNPEVEPPSWRCTPDGSIDPCYRTFHDIAMLSADEGWMVGERGAIFFWNGIEWQEQTTPTRANLNLIIPLSSNNVWAFGQTILHWDGNAWAEYPIPSSMPSKWIMDISFANKDNGWAVVQEYGGQAHATHLLIHWDGSTWERATEIERLRAVHMISEDEGWASSEFGGLYRWDGQHWKQSHKTEFGHGPHQIFFPELNKGWAIDNKGETVYWNGTSWQEHQSLPVLNIYGTAVLNQQAWLTGFNGDTNIMLHWDSQSWTTMSAPPESGIRGLAVVSENDIWAVGEHLIDRYPVVWHWDGETWSPHHTVQESVSVNAFAMVSENEAWGVGENGYIGYWDGQQWQAYPSPTDNDLHGVDFIAPDNGWAIGDHTTMLHWDGNEWSLIKEVDDPRYYTSELQDVSFVSATEIWAAGGINSEGGGGPLLVHLQWDGEQWQELDPQSPYCECYFYSISMLSADDGWAVGGGGVEAATVHWDGQTWQVISNPGNYWFYSVTSLASDSVWANGFQRSPHGNHLGITIHWNGQEWVEKKVTSTYVPLPTSEEWLKGKWILNNFYWDGTDWFSIQNPTTDLIIAGDMTPSGQPVFLTSKGTWLRLNE